MVEQYARARANRGKEKCGDCMFMEPASNEYICMYIAKKHEKRGCPFGNACTKYEPSKESGHAKSRKSLY